MSKTRRKNRKDRADELFSLVIIKGTGKCEYERCKTPGARLTPAHNINRWHDNVRCDTRNAFCLCIFCHTYFEEHEDEFQEWVATTWAFRYMPQLIKKSNRTMGQKIDWDERIEFLTDIVKGIKTLQQARLEEQ